MSPPLPRAVYPSPWHPLAAMAGWLLPGLGHYVLGERRRGAILLLSIGILWLAGLLIGGISVFDRTQHPAWFMGQMLVAPSVLLDLTIQHQLKQRYPFPPLPDRSYAYEPSYGRVNEQGILYTALAGLLNLLAIMDVLYRDAAHRSHQGLLDGEGDVSGGSTPGRGSGGSGSSGGTGGSGAPDAPGGRWT